MSEGTGRRLKKAAEVLYDGNQSAMARDMDMSPQAANKYFQGNRDPGIKILKRLVSIGINASWVIAGIPPMLISDIDPPNTTTATIEDSNLAAEMADDFESTKTDKIFNSVDWGELSNAEEKLLEEVKHFSAFLENRETLRPQVKRLLLELLIQSIDQAIEQREPGQDDN